MWGKAISSSITLILQGHRARNSILHLTKTNMTRNNSLFQRQKDRCLQLGPSVGSASLLWLLQEAVTSRRMVWWWWWGRLRLSKPAQCLTRNVAMRCHTSRMLSGTPAISAPATQTHHKNNPPCYPEVIELQCAYFSACCGAHRGDWVFLC